VTESRDPHLANVLGALAVALSDRIRDGVEAASGLTGAAPAALVSLEQFLGGRSMDDLAHSMGLTHSGAVRLVDRLVGARLVERRPGRDRRTVAIALTARGRRVSQAITEARTAAVEAILADLRVADRLALRSLVDSLTATETRARLAARARGEIPGGWFCRLCDPHACGRPAGDCPAANTAADPRSRLDAPGVAQQPRARPTVAD
jgi:MarR family transcriptional regulator, negative regulator of the multidrug operon emrRAB